MNEAIMNPDAHIIVACDSVIDQIFLDRQTRQTSGATIIAVTAPNPGAGVTYLTSLLADRLRMGADDGVAYVDGRTLRVSHRSGSVGSDPDPNVLQGNRITRRSALVQQWRDRYEYVLVDCPSFSEAQHVLGLAPLIDGVLMVVEANRTQKRQLLYAERTLAAVGGKLVGTVLNKRTYDVPKWAYDKLDAWGV